MSLPARAAGLALLGLAGALGHRPAAPLPPGPPVVQPNDNRTPAGVLRNDTLSIRLVVRMATWHPEADTGPSIDVAAFAEEDRPPEIPGPLIRVPVGTVISATVRNALPDSTLWIHGFATHPAHPDSVALRPGESRDFRFRVGAPGTYFYWAVPGSHNHEKDDEREQISGAFVVDPPGGSPPDRVLVLNIWGTTLDSTHYRNALAINGRSWPFDERISASVGDTVRWRVLNPTDRPHPMHLHGFYYTVVSKGDGMVDTLLRASRRRFVVTETMHPFQTMDLRWVPDRPGNWLFHCHIGFHVVPDARLDPPAAGSHDRMAHDPTVHMAGLVLGITVSTPPGWKEPPRTEPRRLRLLVQEGARRGRAHRALGFVLQRGTMPPAPDSVEIPGSVLLLTQNQPTDITVVNRLREPAAIHWHGLELESFSDGVAGWSGGGAVLAPSIQAGDSFTAHLTMPRAGTFIYHTHMNDIEQITSGLYGAIVVLGPGRRFDPRTDHVFVAGWDGDSDPPHLLVNGDSLPEPPLEFKAGVAHRLRFINIGAGVRFRFSIRRDTSLVTWRSVAKDGADLVPAQAVRRSAIQLIDVGETYDFEWRPAPGEYRLVVVSNNDGKTVFVKRLVVRPATPAPSPSAPAP